MIKKVKREPTFSIIIPTYNRPEMLKRSIESVFKQTFEDFELIIVNDGSEEVYSSIISSYTKMDKRIRVFKNLSNSGAARARNIGIDAARGKLISFLDDDDEYFNNYLMETYCYLNNGSEKICFSWCGVRFLNYSKDYDSPLTITERNFPISYPSRRELYEELLSVGIGFGFTFKAECIRKAGSFNSNLKTVEDTDLFFKMLNLGFLPAVVPNVLATIHNHHYKRLTSTTLYHLRIKECEWLLKKYSKFFESFPSLRNQLELQILNLKKETAKGMVM